MLWYVAQALKTVDVTRISYECDSSSEDQVTGSKVKERMMCFCSYDRLPGPLIGSLLVCKMRSKVVDSLLT